MLLVVLVQILVIVVVLKHVENVINLVIMYDKNNNVYGMNDQLHYIIIINNIIPVIFII